MATNLPQPKGSEAVVAPNIFNIRSLNDFVQLLYVILPLASVTLVSYGVLTEEHAAVWVGLGTSVCQLILQFVRTEAYARKAIYTVLNIANSVLIAYVAGWNPDTLTHLMPLLTVLLGGAPIAVASTNVNTTGDGAGIRVVDSEV